MAAESLIVVYRSVLSQRSNATAMRSASPKTVPQLSTLRLIGLLLNAGPLSLKCAIHVTLAHIGILGHQWERPVAASR